MCASALPSRALLAGVASSYGHSLAWFVGAFSVSAPLLLNVHIRATDLRHKVHILNSAAKPANSNAHQLIRTYRKQSASEQEPTTAFSSKLSPSIAFAPSLTRSLTLAFFPALPYPVPPPPFSFCPTMCRAVYK